MFFYWKKNSSGLKRTSSHPVAYTPWNRNSILSKAWKRHVVIPGIHEHGLQTTGKPTQLQKSQRSISWGRTMATAIWGNLKKYFVSAYFNLICTNQTTSLNQNRRGYVFRLGSHYQKVNLKSQVLEGMTSAKYFLETQMKLGNMDVADVQTPEQNPGQSLY